MVWMPLEGHWKRRIVERGRASLELFQTPLGKNMAALFNVGLHGFLAVVRQNLWKDQAMQSRGNLKSASLNELVPWFSAGVARCDL